jgi:putative FmdB family regulatory protein
MPTYEYVCSKCAHQFELLQRITDKPLTVCPEPLCHQKKWGRGKVKRMISAGGGLLFKGSGFYTTDYRSEGYKKDAKKEVEASTPASGDSKSATDKSSKDTKSAGAGKPADKIETKPAKSKKDG